MLYQLSIFPATHAQAVESRRRSYEEWGKRKRYPLEHYIDESNTMGGKEIAADGKWTTWYGL
ncbi:hypothetical protein EST38_g5951 [Candolleomyces aberdarensis]|uniref:Uncharacterized protein n=1 Tax=Candolleomyces aberdarensis TaxID=2316362 RepID=A0A4V1Q3V5_9AGAR|nr:hypothetical protein EST38_g5951 [Candolleomyces aberdarensis]